MNPPDLASLSPPRTSIVDEILELHWDIHYADTDYEPDPEGDSVQRHWYKYREAKRAPQVAADAVRSGFKLSRIRSSSPFQIAAKTARLAQERMDRLTQKRIQWDQKRKMRRDMRDAQDSEATHSETDTDGTEISSSIDLQQHAERYRIWAEDRRKRRAMRLAADPESDTESETDTDIEELQKVIDKKKVERCKMWEEARRKRRAGRDSEATASETDSDFL